MIFLGYRAIIYLIFFFLLIYSIPWPHFSYNEDILSLNSDVVLSEFDKSDVADPTAEKSSGGLVDRDAVLAKVANEKRLALIKAWEESEKTKAENKAYKKLSAVESWENSSKASVDAQLKKIEEKFEKKKAEYGEKMKNKLAAIHRAAEEKRATVEAKRWEELVKVEDTATKFRTAGYVPRNLLGCFSY